MQLYVLRHGSAVEPERWRGVDEQRPLTDEGREEMRLVARGLKWLGVEPDIVLTSPYLRARQTAEPVAGALGVAIAPAPELVPGCDLDRFCAALAGSAVSRQPKGVLVVGHEPDLSTVVGLLVGSMGPARIEMKKASCARVDLAPPAFTAQDMAGLGTLAWLLRAKHLARLGA